MSLSGGGRTEKRAGTSTRFLSLRYRQQSLSASQHFLITACTGASKSSTLTFGALRGNTWNSIVGCVAVFFIDWHSSLDEIGCYGSFAARFLGTGVVAARADALQALLWRFHDSRRIACQVYSEFHWRRRQSHISSSMRFAVMPATTRVVPVHVCVECTRV